MDVPVARKRHGDDVIFRHHRPSRFVLSQSRRVGGCERPASWRDSTVRTVRDIASANHSRIGCRQDGIRATSHVFNRNCRVSGPPIPNTAANCCAEHIHRCHSRENEQPPAACYIACTRHRRTTGIIRAYLGAGYRCRVVCCRARRVLGLAPATGTIREICAGARDRGG